MAARKTASRGKKPGNKATSDLSPNLRTLEQLVAILEDSSLSELTYEDENLAVSLKRGGSAATLVATAPASIAPPAGPVAEAPGASVEVDDDKDVHVIRSPFVGTFYRSPSPDAGPFTEVDKKVRRGQTVCIVEAMKLMNEIEAEVDGVVIEVLVDNAQTVQYGDPLFRVRV